MCRGRRIHMLGTILQHIHTHQELPRILGTQHIQVGQPIAFLFGEDCTKKFLNAVLSGWECWDLVHVSFRAQWAVNSMCHFCSFAVSGEDAAILAVHDPYSVTVGVEAMARHAADNGVKLRGLGLHWDKARSSVQPQPGPPYVDV